MPCSLSKPPIVRRDGLCARCTPLRFQTTRRDKVAHRQSKTLEPRSLYWRRRRYALIPFQRSSLIAGLSRRSFSVCIYFCLLTTKSEQTDFRLRHRGDVFRPNQYRTSHRQKKTSFMVWKGEEGGVARQSHLGPNIARGRFSMPSLSLLPCLPRPPL